MNADQMIRFTAVLNRNGEKISGGHRPNLTPLLTEDEQKMELYHAGQRWETRNYMDHKMGKAKYSMTEYDKIKRATFPLDERHILLVSMDSNSQHQEIINNIMGLILKNNDA